MPHRCRSVESMESRRLFAATLYALPFDTRVGESPATSLVADAVGNLYGALSFGGAGGAGSVFELEKGALAPKTLASFAPIGGTAPLPTGITVDAAGNVFGITSSGGGSFGGVDGAAGTIFKIPRGQSSIQTLFSFGSFAALPSGITLDPATGNLFITTLAGGTGFNQTLGKPGVGGVYELPSGASTLTSLGTFDAPSTGSSPHAAVTLDTQGNLFGVTSAGGAGVTPGPSGSGYGAVFEIPSGTQTIVPVAAFSGDNGAKPLAPLLLTPAGDIYGETSQGGASFVANDSSKPGYGAIFKISAGTSEIVRIASFDNTTTGGTPTGGLVSDAGGNLFGTASAGATGNGGTVFELAAGASSITPLQTFPADTLAGTNPSQGVYLDSSGDRWGTTEFGGAGGSLFDLSASGANPFITTPGPLNVSLSKSTLPASILSESAVRQNATVRITNTGALPIKGRATVKLYLSANGVIDDLSAAIGTKMLTLNLKGSASTTTLVPISFKATSAAQSDFLIARVIDPSSTATDVNTERQVSIQAASFAFDVLALTASPLNLKAGRRATFTLTLKNVGNISNVQAHSTTAQLVLTPNAGGAPTTLTLKIATTILPGATKILKFGELLAKQLTGSTLSFAVSVPGETFTSTQKLVVA